MSDKDITNGINPNANHNNINKYLIMAGIIALAIVIGAALYYTAVQPTMTTTTTETPTESNDTNTTTVIEDNTTETETVNVTIPIVVNKTEDTNNTEIVIKNLSLDVKENAST